MSDERFMRMAITEAREGIRQGQTPFGACIVKAGKVVACAHNAVWKNTDILAHAEMQAICLANRKLKSLDLSGCVIYSTCEPCPMCFSACHWGKVSRIVFWARIKDARDFGFSELTVSNLKMKQLGSSRIKVDAGVLVKENRELFSFWQKQPGSRVY